MFDLVHHVDSLIFHLVMICVTHLDFIPGSHLSLSIVEQILMQLSVCQSYDNTGGAITCRQKELAHVRLPTVVVQNSALQHCLRQLEPSDLFGFKHSEIAVQCESSCEALTQQTV